MRNKGIQAILGLLLFLSCVSCDNKVIYFKQYSLPNHVWSNDLSAVYIFEAADPKTPLTLNFSFRTTTDFKYKAFYYYTELINPAGKKNRFLNKIETIGDQGQWLGKKTGSIVEFNKQIPLPKPLLKGKYKVNVSPAITQSLLSEILDMGLMVNRD
jgi:gliding motility-associated lipoprotein GldH